MINDLLHYTGWVTAPRDQAAIDAPRVVAPVDVPTSWTRASRTGALPMRTAGHAQTRRLAAGAPVTVPAHVVITVCPSMDQLAAARRAALAAPLVGEPLGLQADWLAQRAPRPVQRKTPARGGA